MQEILSLLSPNEAWDELMKRKTEYYDRYAALYSGDLQELKRTGDYESFWRRKGKGRVHVPVAADIAATSSDLLFSEEPRITCFDEETEDASSDKQKRLDFLLSENSMFSKLNEGAETAAALGDVFYKINWDTERLECPTISIVRADNCLPEYRFGVLRCIHFYTTLKITKEGVYFRLYERYEPGFIICGVYKGDSGTLGTEQLDSALEDLGLQGEIVTPVEDMLAIHVPNMKPNRLFKDFERGRSDLEGLRNLSDALDEAYSSWLRDIRLAKSRLIVPAEYLRRKPSDLFKDNSYTYEFDEDVETLVALDIDTDKVGVGITPSQFEIRSAEHLSICTNLISSIVSMAGYSPQTFGINIDGSAQSGTALHIREKKSYNTRGKKQTYWASPIKQLLTALVRLDAVLYPGNATDNDDTVKIAFSDTLANDLSSLATSIDLLNRAAAISTETKINMLHPDWSGKQISEEIDRVKAENGLALESPLLAMGDFERENPLEEPEEIEQEEEEAGR